MIRSELCRSSGFEQSNELNIFHDPYLVQLLDSRINPFAKDLKVFSTGISDFKKCFRKSSSEMLLGPD